VSGVPDLDGVVVDEEIDRRFGFASDDQMVKTGPGHFGCKESAHVGAAEQAGQRRFSHDVGAGRGRSAGGGQNSAADDQCVARSQRVAAFLGVIVEQVSIETPAPEIFFTHFQWNGCDLDLAGGQIDVGNFSIQRHDGFPPF
jgi:hypothetical protein